MKEKFENIIQAPFKVCSHIENYETLLVYSINNAPQSSVIKFLIRTVPLWRVFTENEWNKIAKKINNEIALLNLTIFFGRYLKIDLLKSIKEKGLEIKDEYLNYTRKYIDKSNSLLYLDKKYKDSEMTFYIGDNEFMEIRNQLLDNGFINLENVPPPEVINI